MASTRRAQLEYASMCGRYRLSRRKELLAEHFGTNFDDLDWEPRYNLAPTQPVPVIRYGSGQTTLVSSMRWGLIPSWTAYPAIGSGAINVRSETAASKASFRESMQARRCLIPADGFYEWQRAGREKQPFCFELANNCLFAFAGLWDRWRNPNEQVMETCAILTTAANELLSDVHHRMPVILASEHYDLWLDPTVRDAGHLLKPFDSQLMRKYAVSSRVNLAGNDGPECCVPFRLPAPAATLFD